MNQQEQKIVRMDDDPMFNIAWGIKPPVWDAVVTMIGYEPSAFFTYGNTLYNPDSLQLPDHIIIHEKVHMEQQGYCEEGAKVWWDKFLADSKFMVAQEAQAYGIQYSYMCRQVKDRNARLRLLMQLAKSLSGPIYKHSVTHSEAMLLISSHVVC